MEDEKNIGGRPPLEITQELISKAENYASRGLTQEQIALCLGMGESTFYEKLNRYPDFKEAIKRGKSNGIAMVADNLLNNVKNGNVTAQIFYLKCQANWKETEVKEITGKDGSPLVSEAKITTDMIDGRIAHMLEKK